MIANPRSSWAGTGLQKLVLHENQLMQAPNSGMVANPERLLGWRRPAGAGAARQPAEAGDRPSAQFPNRKKWSRAGAGLQELVLHDNQLRQAPELGAFGGLQRLELSYNELRSLAPLAALAAPGLAELFAASNKLPGIEAVAGRPALRLLELGCNRIRDLHGLERLPALEQVHGIRDRVRVRGIRCMGCCTTTGHCFAFLAMLHRMARPVCCQAGCWRDLAMGWRVLDELIAMV